MRKPRILIVVNVYPPDQCGGAVIFGDLSQGLVERGYDVTVRCAYPYYPEWRDKSGQNGLKITRYEEAGVHVERFGLYIPRNPNSLAERLLYEFSFFASLARRRHDNSPFDAVMVFCPLVGAVAYAALYGKRNHVPIWLNVQDLPTDAATAGGITSRGSTARFLQSVQEWLFNQADIWTSISPRMVERLRSMTRHHQPVYLLPNWLHRSLREAIQHLDVKAPRNMHTPVRLFYSGNIGSKQDLLHFCQILHESPASFVFRIHGDGAEAPALRQWIETTGDSRFVWGDFLEEQAYIRLLFESDFLVVTEKTGSGGSFIPSKIIPAMAAGVPILAVSDADSPLGREMREAEPGPWFSWEDISQLLELLEAIPPERYRYWHTRALERVLFYDREYMLDRYEEVLHQLLQLNPAFSATQPVVTETP